MRLLCVKPLEGGRFSCPTDFPPLDMKPETVLIKHLEILLDGQGCSQIAQEMTAEHKDIGVKISVN